MYNDWCCSPSNQKLLLFIYCLIESRSNLRAKHQNDILGIIKSLDFTNWRNFFKKATFFSKQNLACNHDCTLLFICTACFCVFSLFLWFTIIMFIYFRGLKTFTLIQWEVSLIQILFVTYFKKTFFDSWRVWAKSIFRRTHFSRIVSMFIVS